MWGWMRAVVHVPVQDHNPLNPSARQRRLSSNRAVVEETKPHRPVALRVVPRRPNHSESARVRSGGDDRRRLRCAAGGEAGGGGGVLREEEVVWGGLHRLCVSLSGVEQRLRVESPEERGESGPVELALWPEIAPAASELKEGAAAVRSPACCAACALRSLAAVGFPGTRVGGGAPRQRRCGSAGGHAAAPRPWPSAAAPGGHAQQTCQRTRDTHSRLRRRRREGERNAGCCIGGYRWVSYGWVGAGCAVSASRLERSALVSKTSRAEAADDAGVALRLLRMAAERWVGKERKGGTGGGAGSAGQAGRDGQLRTASAESPGGTCDAAAFAAAAHGWGGELRAHLGGPA